MEAQRSGEARARAERALVRLVHELDDETLMLIVLGGLVPALLAQDGIGVPEHLGTTDVDILLITHVDPDADLGSVERALERLHFAPDPRQDGWRWRGVVDGSPVLIEFLCDLRDYPERESIRPAGCTQLAAANLRGTGYVAHDFEWRKLTGKLADGREVSVRVRFAGLQGYLLSKCVTARSRGETRDYYDLVFVLLHHRAGGPEAAAQLLLTGEFASDLDPLRSTFLEVRERYHSTSAIGPQSYAEQAMQVEPAADAATLRADALDVVQRFFTALGL